MTDEPKQPEEQPEDLIEKPAAGRPKYDTVRSTWNFSVDNIRSATPHYNPEDQADLIALFLWCIDPLHPIRREDTAARMECSTDLIYQLLTGKYREPDAVFKNEAGKETSRVKGKPKGPSDDFMDKLRVFLKTERERYEAISTDFITTGTAKKVSTACDLARESKTPVILFGPSHIGKTLALRHYQANHNHGRTFMAEMDADCGRAGIIEIIAKACGVATGSDTKNEVVFRIKKALLAPGTVLILDEMHLVKRSFSHESFVKIVETIRRIQDFTKCGMVLSWTNLDDLKEFSQDVLIQLWRRGVHKVGLPLMPTKEDLTAILKHHGLEFPARDLTVRIGKVTESPYEILRQQSKNNGLKAITERIRYGQKIATKRGGKLTWDHFVDAHLRIEKNAIQEGEWE